MDQRGWVVVKRGFTCYLKIGHCTPARCPDIIEVQEVFQFQCALKAFFKKFEFEQLESNYYYTRDARREYGFPTVLADSTGPKAIAAGGEEASTAPVPATGKRYAHYCTFQFFSHT